MHLLENCTWTELYDTVLKHGQPESPRERPTLALNNVMYSMEEGQHFDANPIRDLNLNYVFREFLWFITGNGYDTRMTKYAPIWKTCVNRDGRINSNYGQYMFYGGLGGPFFRALNVLANDADSRRCWIPIFQSGHQTVEEHTDYPCTTGVGFIISDGKLHMNVHMRSQDLWWGAANDEPVTYLLQLTAIAYLWAGHGVKVYAGPIVHYIDNLHVYERHYLKAVDARNAAGEDREEVEEVNELAKTGFNTYDLGQMFNTPTRGEYSPLMKRVLDIPGDYGFQDTERQW